LGSYRSTGRAVSLALGRGETALPAPDFEAVLAGGFRALPELAAFFAATRFFGDGFFMRRNLHECARAGQRSRARRASGSPVRRVRTQSRRSCAPSFS